jgi:hypothetical protein
MAPPAADIDLVSHTSTGPIHVKKVSAESSLKGPLLNSGSLDQYKSFDVTKVIGREFPELQLSDILADDQKIRDLAITGKLIASLQSICLSLSLTKWIVSQRGVVFFRNQSLNIEEQKVLGTKLGELTGKPESSKV